MQMHVQPDLGWCQARAWTHDRAVPGYRHVDSALPCPEPAAAVVRLGCVHEHVKEARLCDVHSQGGPAGSSPLCAPCARMGHDCPVLVQAVDHVT